MTPPDDRLRIMVCAPRVDVDPNGPSVSVVIPALNEERNLPWVAERMPGNVKEILLVDGRSRDATVKVARELWPNVRVIRQTRPGKGSALACGFDAATSDIVVMLDADGSMDPGEIPYFVQALVDGADFAKGSRFAPGGGSLDITGFRAAGNRALNWLTGRIHSTKWTDLCYGYIAFWRRVLPAFELDVSTPPDGGKPMMGDGFEIETLLNLRAHRAGLRIVEVPSFETLRLYGTSNLKAVKDGLRVLGTIAREDATWGRRTLPMRVHSRPYRRWMRIRSATPAMRAYAMPGLTPSESLEVTCDISVYPSVPLQGDAHHLEVVDLAAYEREVDEAHRLASAVRTGRR
jgi:glycosyltransferase involved in cell wall biosynthesis